MIEINPSKSFDCIKMTMLSLFIAGALAGCGIRGPLKTPPPLFGGDAKVNQDTPSNQDSDSLEDEDDDYLDLDLDVDNQNSLGG